MFEYAENEPDALFLKILSVTQLIFQNRSFDPVILNVSFLFKNLLKLKLHFLLNVVAG